MSVLSNEDIAYELNKGNIVIDPLTPEQLQPASVDLRLGKGMLNISNFQPGMCIRFDEKIRYEEKQAQFLSPGEFALATTMEYIKVPDNMIARVYGRSSIGRAGLIIETAAFIDPGYEGEITLELYNLSPRSIELKEGARICQLVFEYTQTPSNPSYQGKYQKQKGATGSRIHEDFNKNIR